MKKTLTLCVVALSTGLWLSPAAAAVAGTSDRRFLAGGRRKALAHEASSSVLADGLSALPLAEVLKKAQADAAAKAAAAAQKDFFAKAEEEKKKAAAKAAAEAAAKAKAKPAPAPAPAAPAPAPLPVPAPAPMPEIPTIPPIPPCNWTYDWEEVARPAVCINMSDGNHSCLRSANLTFDDDITTCYPPTVSRCENPTKNGQLPVDYVGTETVPLYAITPTPDFDADQDTFKHGIDFKITCSENATAVDHRYILESWGQDWYPGIQEATGVCNNGSIIRTDPTNMTFFPGHPFYKPPGIVPTGLRCVLKEKVKLTQDVISYLRWSEPRMTEAETRGYKWIDMDALLHKKLLKDAMNESAHIEIAARSNGELTDIPRLKRVIKALITQRMIPRGEPMTQETCKDLEKHWLYELENSDPFKKANNIGYANWVPPVDKKIGYPTADDIKLQKAVGFTCSYTLQKSGAGRDPFSGAMNYRYRDGCFCESRWIGGCPFRVEFSPSYKTFGFDALEVKGVSTAVGAATNALCWYFTKPANPEWGYLRTDTGYSYQAPGKNVTQLKKGWLKLRKLAQKARFERGRY